MLFSSGGRRSSSSAFRTSSLVNSVNRPLRSSPLHTHTTSSSASGGGGEPSPGAHHQQHQSLRPTNRTSSPTDRHRHPHRHNNPSNVYHYRHHQHTQHQQRSPYRKQNYEADEPLLLPTVLPGDVAQHQPEEPATTVVVHPPSSGVIGPVKRLLQRHFVHSNSGPSALPATDGDDTAAAVKTAGEMHVASVHHNVVGGGKPHSAVDPSGTGGGGVRSLPSNSSSSSLAVASNERRHSPMLSASSFVLHQQQQQHSVSSATNRPPPAVQTIYEHRESNVFGWPAQQQSPARNSSAAPGIVLERARFDATTQQQQQQLQQQTSLEMPPAHGPSAASSVVIGGGLAPHLLHTGDANDSLSAHLLPHHGGGVGVGGVFHIKKSDSHQSQAAIAHMHNHHATVHALATARSTKWLPAQIGGMRIFYAGLNAVVFGCAVAGAIITLRLACTEITERFGPNAEEMPIWLAWFYGCWLLPVAFVALIVIRICSAAEHHGSTHWCYVSGCGSASREADDSDEIPNNNRNNNNNNADLDEEKDELNMSSESFSLFEPLKCSTAAILMPRRRITGYPVSIFRTLALMLACALSLMGSLYLFIMGAYRLQLTCVIVCMFTLITSLNFCGFWVWFHDAFVGTKLLATTIAAAGYTLIAYSDGFIYTGMPMRARGILFVTSSAIVGAIGILLLRMATVERKLRDLRMIELGLLQSLLGLINLTALWCVPLVFYLSGLEPMEDVTQLPFRLIVGSAALMLLAMICVLLETSALQVSSIHAGFMVAIFVCYILDNTLTDTSMTSYEWAGALCMTLAMLIGMLPGELAYFCIALLPGKRFREKLLQRDAVHKRINDFRLGPRELLRLYAVQEAKLANLSVQRERKREQLRLANERNASNRTLLHQAMSTTAQVTAAVACVAPTPVAPPTKSPVVQHMIRLASAHPFQGGAEQNSGTGISGSTSNTALLSAAGGHDGQ